MIHRKQIEEVVEDLRTFQDDLHVRIAGSQPPEEIMRRQAIIDRLEKTIVKLQSFLDKEQVGGVP